MSSILLNIGEKLNSFFNEKGLTSYKISQITGISEPTIGRYRLGQTDPTIKNLIAMFESFPEMEVYIFGKDFSQMANKDTTIPKDAVPYWNLIVSAGHSIKETIGATKPDGYIKGLPGLDIVENVLPVSGASMEPEISSGAIIGVRKMNSWDTLNTERIYLIITRDDRMIKRIEHDPEDENIIWCVSPNYTRFKIYKSEIIEVHRVCFVYNPK